MTAIEWLMEQITYTNEFGCVCNSFIETADLSMYFEQAKKMEKQQIIDACSSTDNTDFWVMYSSYEEYYNKKFKMK